ncbi:MAG TPA: M23 family metallopeptidase [Azospirillaceae bacterium]|nr:M23 family metallopeptidase [Azospirillaceae bacterium]
MFSSIVRNERVIIVEDDRIRSVVIGPRQRLRPALLVALAFLGMLLTGAGWIATWVKLNDARREAALVEEGSRTLAASLEESRATASGLAQKLAAAGEALDQALGHEQALRERLAAAATRLEQAAEADAKALRLAAAGARSDLKAADPALSGTLEAASASLDQLRSASLDLAARRAQAAAASVEVTSSVLGSGDPGALSAEGIEGLGQALVAAKAEAAGLRAEAASLQTREQAMVAERAGAERRVQAVNEAQLALLARLTQHADLRIGQMESALKGTGIDIEAVLAKLGRDGFGMGGPLVALPELPGDLLPPAATQAMAKLENRLERQAKLQALRTVLPLTAPVDDFYVASGFGKRRDPFTKQWAMHEGIDLVAQLRSPVAATAAGTVVEVGYDGGYGHQVTIDHGFGIRTRYAHLEKAMVREGERIAHGQQIGTLGNSGRSSGPHVHYEVMVGGRPVDPLVFMEKGRHVCEG